MCFFSIRFHLSHQDFKDYSSKNSKLRSYPSQGLCSYEHARSYIHPPGKLIYERRQRSEAMAFIALINIKPGLNNQSDTSPTSYGLPDSGFFLRIFAYEITKKNMSRFLFPATHIVILWYNIL